MWFVSNKQKQQSKAKRGPSLSKKMCQDRTEAMLDWRGHDQDLVLYKHYRFVMYVVALLLSCYIGSGWVTDWCRKPKPNLELVAQQVAQQLPPPPKREKPTTHIRRPERPELSGETDTSQDSHRSDSADQNEHRKRYLCWYCGYLCACNNFL